MADASYKIRLTNRAAYEEKARELNLTLAEWMRAVMDKEALVRTPEEVAEIRVRKAFKELQVTTDPREIAAYEAQAARSNLTSSEWARINLNALAGLTGAVISGSAKGRPSDFDSDNAGSTPAPESKKPFVNRLKSNWEPK